MAFDYPIMLDLQDIPVVVIGGGRVAVRKVEGLVRAGAAVTVVAPDVIDEMRPLAGRIVARPYEPADLDGARLVFTATNDRAVNAAVAADANARGVWVNSADDPANCTFTLPAVARDGAVTVAVSTGGASPALASHLRAEFDARLRAIGAGRAAEQLAAQRAEIQAAGRSTESIDWSERIRASLTHEL